MNNLSQSSGNPSVTATTLVLRAFPFFIEWDGDLRITSVGPSLGKICAEAVPGAGISEIFTLRRPVGVLSADFFRKSGSLLILFEAISSGLMLRGEVSVLEDSGNFLMLAAPWISDPDEVERLGLTLSDFANHDQTMDMLQIVQTQRMANDDLLALAAKLTAQRTLLRAKEAEARKLALVASRTDNSVIVTDAQGRIEWVNEGFVRLTGWTLEEVLGKTPGSVLQGPETSPSTVEMMRGQLRKGEGFRAEVLNYGKDGRKYWISAEVQPILNEAGEVTNFMAVQSDITERIYGERRRNIQYSLSRILAGGSSLNATQATILKSICDGLGWSIGCFWMPSPEGDELILANSWHSPAMDCRAMFDENHRRRFRMGEDLPGRVWQSGQSTWVPDITVDEHFTRSSAARTCGLRTALALPIFNSGVFQGMMEFFSPDIGCPNDVLLQTLDGICNQIGQFIVRKKAEEQLIRAKDAAEAANRAKSDFLAMMSHEIRTPMNGVLGFTQLLQNGDLSAQQTDFVTAIRTSAESLLRVINDVLDFSKIESGHMEMEESPFSLQTCIEEAVETVSISAAEKNLDLAARIAPEVPSSIMGDSLRLRQILVNLLGNAVKFTSSGEVKLEVDASPEASGNVMLHFRVTDTGIGISPERMGHLFKAFHQVDNSTSRRFGGSGLGLAICKRLVELMGGTIAVESRAGEGSVFSFRISVAAADHPEPLIAPVPFPGLMGRRVLVVDGHGFSRQVITELLERWGMDARSAGSSNEAAAMLHDWLPHVLLLDSGCKEAGDVSFVTSLIRGGVKFFLLCKPGDSVESLEILGNASLGLLCKPLKVSPLFNALMADQEGPVPYGGIASGRSMPLVTDGKPLRILLAEDNAINRKLALAALAQMGCDADIAVDGHEALSAAMQTRYDVILMDVQMPDMDGLEATRRIRLWERETGVPRVRIIALTANALAGDRDTCLDAGMDEYLSKPIRLDALRKAVRKPGEAGAPLAKAKIRTPSPVMTSLRQLARDLSPDDAVSLASDFLADLDGQLGAIREAMDRSRMDEAGRHAHSLKGSASIFALAGLQGAAGTVEQACRLGSLEDAEAAWPDLQKAAQEAVGHLRPAIADIASATIIEPMS